MMFGLRDPFRYGECQLCPLLWLMDPPVDWSRYYPPHYEAFSAPRRGWVARAALRSRDRHALTGKGIIGRFLDEFAPNERLRALRPFGLHKDARILDVGAGEGTTVRALRRLGWESAVGIDPFLERDILEAGRVVVHRRQIDEERGPFDLVMFHHSFEHMDNPRNVLGSVRRLLGTGGSCMIRIPIFPSWAWDQFDTDWVQLDAPRHSIIHSVNSIKRLANETGFVVDCVVHDSGILQFWGSEQYAADIPLLDPETGRMQPRMGSVGRTRRRQLTRKARQLNTEGRGDQAAIYLRQAGAT